MFYHFNKKSKGTVIFVLIAALLVLLSSLVMVSVSKPTETYAAGGAVAVLKYKLISGTYEVTGIDPNNASNIANKTNLAIVIPATYSGKPVTRIAAEAFRPINHTFTSLDLSGASNLTSIGQMAFLSSSALKGTLVLPDSITTIEMSAFNGCSGLTGTLTLPNSITSIEAAAFKECSGLTGTLTLPNSITSIGGNTFQDCSGLTALALPNSITSIGNSAFNGCSKLTGALTLPNSITSIGNSAFNGCSGLTGALTLPNSITSIGKRAFNNCTGFDGALTLPNSITSIAEYAFYNCSGFTGTLTLPTNSSFTKVEARAFRMCRGFTALILPDNITVIADSAFDSCINLTSLSLPSALTSIGTYAFSSCSRLTGALTLPDSITEIANGAFYDCGFDGTLTLPASLTKINSYAFRNCNFTGALSLPATLTNIGGSAFKGCSNLETIYLPNNTQTSFDSQAFDGSTCPIVAANKAMYEGYLNSPLANYAARLTYELDITFDAVGGTFGDAQTLSQIKLYNHAISFEKSETGVWASSRSYALPTPTNGLATFDGWKNGTDSVTAETKVTADPATFSAQWSIVAPVINSTTGYSGTYDGAGHNISISATHATEGATLTYQWYKGAVGSGVLIADQTAATLSVKDVADSGSYYCIVTASYLQITQSAQSVAIAVSILQKEIGLTWAGIDDLVYSGLAKTTTASATDIAVGDTCNIAVQLTADHNNIDVGTFTYTAISVDNANYKLPTAATSGEYVITPKEVAAVWTKAGSYIYTGASQLDTISAKFVGVDGDIALTVAVVGDAEFKNAGTYSFGATNTNPNYNVTGLTLADVVIEAVTIEKPTLADDSLEYNGLVQTADIATNDLYTLSGHQQTNAGLYTLTITLKSTVNSKWADGTTDAFTIAWTIAKAGLTVAADNKTVTYNVAFDAFTASYTGFVNDETVAVLGGTLAYACGYQVGNNAGSYPIAPSGYTSDNYNINYVAGTLTVQKATVEKPTLASNNLVYNGLVQTADIATSERYTIADDKKTDAGSYSATVTLNNTTNYKWADGEDEVLNIAWTIAKAELTVKADDKTVTYNVAFDAFTVSCTGFVNSETVAVLGGTLAYVCDYQVGTNVGSYPIAPSGYTSDNYNINYVAGTLTVQKATVAKPTLASNNLVYNGLVQTADIATSELYTIADDKKTDAGSYSATVTLTDTTNYKWVEGEIEVLNIAWTIAKAELTVKADDKTVTYNVAFDAFTVSCTGFVNSETVAVLGGTLAYVCDYQVGTNVGSYSITPSGYTSDNYTIKYVAGTLTVQKATVAKPTLTGGDRVYNGVAQLPAIATSDLYTIEGSGTNAGDYTSTITLTDTTNYKWVDGEDEVLTVTWAITKAELTVTADDKTVTYNVAFDAFTARYTGLVNGETVAVLGGTLTFNDYEVGSDVKTYPITPGGYTSDNYTIKYVDGTLTVQKATVAKPTLTGGNRVYNGVAQLPNIAENVLYKIEGEQKNAGEGYTSTITLTDTTNYKWVEGEIEVLTVTWAITKAELTVTADDKTVTYNEAFDAFTASYTGFVNGETVAVLGGTLAFNCAYAAGSNAGSTHTIAKTEESGYTSDNYTIKYVDGTLTVQKATFDMGGITFADVTLVEDDSVHTLVITGTLPEGVTVSYAGTNDYVVGGVSAAGIYTVTAIFTVADPDNFNVPEPMAATLIINIDQITDETEDGETGVIVGGANGMKPGTTIEVEEKSADAYKESNIVINGEKQTVLQVAGIEMLLDGAITQPDGSITIRLLIKSSLRSYSDLVVVSMAADGTSTNMNAVRDGNYLVFDTTYLTDYAIVAPTSIVSPPVLSGGAIAGIVIASIFVVLALIILAMFIFRKDKKVGFKAYYAGLTNKSTAKIKGLFKKDKNEVK